MDLAFPKPTRKKRVAKRYGVAKEEILQAEANEYLDSTGIKYLRIPNEVLKYVTGGRVEGWFREWFLANLAAVPDNTIQMPIGNGMFLGVQVELKSKKGKLHGQQKNNAEAEKWFVVRTMDELKSVVERSATIVTKMKCALAMTTEK